MAELALIAPADREAPAVPLAEKARVPRQRRAGEVAMPPQAVRRRRALAAFAAASVAVVLTGLSLSHLAHGIEIVTGATPVECWAMAVGIDAGFLTSEMALLCSGAESIRRSVGWWAHPTIATTLILSACMNALAFSHGSEGWRTYIAATLGLVIPALVYSLARIAFVLATQINRPEA